MSKTSETAAVPDPTTRRNVWALLLIFALAVTVRTLTAYFVGTHLDDAGWFPFGIYNIFDEQARAIVDGTSAVFWMTDPANVKLLIYPPGYAIWLAVVYAVSGDRSPHIVQIIQVLLDSASVLLIVRTGEAVFSRSIGRIAGVFAALSPLLAFYGATPLADSPTSWLVLSGMFFALKTVKTDSVLYALSAGAAIGASCWLRSNGLLLSLFLAAAVLLCLRARVRRRMLVAASLVLAAVVVVAPIMVRNSIAFQTFVPTGMGVGTNLWEGIGETGRADEFGAVYGDSALLQRERTEMGRTADETIGLYWPDGVQRDRERASRAIAVIESHPFWYAGVMARRMWGLLKYAGEDSALYGSTGINVTTAKCLPPSLRVFPLNLIVTLIGYVQSVLRFLLLPLAALGLWQILRGDWRKWLPLLLLVVYYLVVGTSLHSEIRYSLPMQATLMVFAAAGAAWLMTKIRSLPRPA
jgi:hypothetical protein